MCVCVCVFVWCVVCGVWWWEGGAPQIAPKIKEIYAKEQQDVAAVHSEIAAVSCATLREEGGRVGGGGEGDRR